MHIESFILMLFCNLIFYLLLNFLLLGALNLEPRSVASFLTPLFFLFCFFFIMLFVCYKGGS